MPDIEPGHTLIVVDGLPVTVPDELLAEGHEAAAAHVRGLREAFHGDTLDFRERNVRVLPATRLKRRHTKRLKTIVRGS